MWQVEWDESAASERQERVSLWEIEPFNSVAILPPLSLGQNPSQKRRPNKPTLGKIPFSRMHTTIDHLSFLEGHRRTCIGDATVAPMLCRHDW